MINIYSEILFLVKLDGRFEFDSNSVEARSGIWDRPVFGIVPKYRVWQAQEAWRSDAAVQAALGACRRCRCATLPKISEPTEQSP